MYFNLFILTIYSNIINLIEELNYWDKTGIEIPRQISKLLEKSDAFLKRMVRVMQNVKFYNRYVKNFVIKKLFFFWGGGEAKKKKRPGMLV